MSTCLKIKITDSSLSVTAPKIAKHYTVFGVKLTQSRGELLSGCSKIWHGPNFQDEVVYPGREIKSLNNTNETSVKK